MPPQAERLPLGGPYVPAETAAAETTYLPNPRYFAAVAMQPQEIVQRRFPRRRGGCRGTAARRNRPSGSPGPLAGQVAGGRAPTWWCNPTPCRVCIA